ncbi:hypothetical protein GORHZ_141_00740 [Gordonia rhizosphera NBRC 16068]|uniref:Uncharacterized protein n=1 Tax=Gordonia rhizosphera NBRC 16068 TaxID=1108045 RepID=K6WYR6_9ACTN|nr:hypothetical protein GORHZ_141_00740 [Gordonia rhizosphera NBRC 16068]
MSCHKGTYHYESPEKVSVANYVDYHEVGATVVVDTSGAALKPVLGVVDVGSGIPSDVTGARSLAVMLR